MTDPRHQSVFQNIENEHKQMRTMLGEVHTILTARSESVANVKSALEKLRVYLKDHFHNEDEGGFFRDIVSQAPRLGERVKEVSGEHADLLTAFTDFANRAEQGDACPSWWEEINTEFHRISKRLMEHEHREQDLLQRAFNEDIGTGD